MNKDTHSYNVVLPGDELTTAEEYSPDSGAYEDKTGIIRAEIVGIPKFDNEDRTVTVEPLTNTPNVLKEGDIIIGRVKDVKKSFALVELGAKSGSNRQIAGSGDAKLHISKLSHEYFNDIRQAVRPGDIIRARVLDTSAQISLSTNEKNLGVIWARCPVCSEVLRAVDGNLLECPVCEKRWIRKLAEDFGRANIFSQ